MSGRILTPKLLRRGGLPTSGKFWNAYPLRPGLYDDVIGVPPGGLPDQQPNWDLLFTIDQPQGKPYRPSNWSQGQQYSIVVTSMPEGGQPGDSATVYYFFDAMLQAEHSQVVTVTHHPIQSGAAVSDHAFVDPVELVLSVAFSDVVDRYNDTDYMSDTSKSISAYQTFLDLQAKLLPLTVVTRLRQYDNMVLTEVRAVEDASTITGLRCQLTFTQIVMAEVSTSTVEVPVISQRPDQSEGTNEGTKTTVEPSPSLSTYINAIPLKPSTGFNVGPQSITPPSLLRKAQRMTRLSSKTTATAAQTAAPTLRVIGAGKWSSEPLTPSMMQALGIQESKQKVSGIPETWYERRHLALPKVLALPKGTYA